MEGVLRALDLEGLDLGIKLRPECANYLSEQGRSVPIEL